MSGEAGASVPACRKCRSHRVRCDRMKPVCGRCSRLGHQCQYPIKNPATAYFKYMQTLEAEIAKLEQQQHQDREHGAESAEHASTMTEMDISPQDNGFPSVMSRADSAAPSDSLISDLFAHATVAGQQDRNNSMSTLVDDLAQVSLSAMTANAALSSHDVVLGTLLLSAAMPPADGPQLRPQAHFVLPSAEIAQRVCARYCENLLPELPILDAAEVQIHLREAYQAHHPYSIFVIVTILATTAVALSPASTNNAVSLYLTGLQYLETSFATHEQRDSLQDLETAVILGHFASRTTSQYADLWALSGLAIRIAVDLGLHKKCDNNRKRRLFWAAYTLDRKAATGENRPLGIPDDTIDTTLTPHLGILQLYRTISTAYHRMSCHEPAGASDDLEEDLHQWERTFRTGRQLSHALEEDVSYLKILLRNNDAQTKRGMSIFDLAPP